jgi:hypothetical protein
MYECRDWKKGIGSLAPNSHQMSFPKFGAWIFTAITDFRSRVYNVTDEFVFRCPRSRIGAELGPSPEVSQGREFQKATAT